MKKLYEIRRTIRQIIIAIVGTLLISIIGIICYYITEFICNILDVDTKMRIIYEIVVICSVVFPGSLIFDQYILTTK